MDNLYASSLIIGAFQRCRNSFYVESPKTPSTDAINNKALLQFLIQLEQAYKYQLSLKKAQRPKRKLPPVPKFEESEPEPELQKKVQVLSESKPEVNVLAKSSLCESQGITQAPIKRAHSTAAAEMDNEEEEKSISPESSDEKTNVLSQMNQMFGHNEQETPTFIATPENDKKDLAKFRKLNKCLTELINKLGIEDTSVPVYCKEFLQLVVPQLLVHFNKKPFIAIAAAILIFACYKADYHITTKKIIEASEAKETMVVKCFYSIKEILANKKNN